MVQLSECLSGRVVLRCDCRASLVLVGLMVAPHSEHGHPECGVCGERFVPVRTVARQATATGEHRETRSSKEEKFRYS